MLRWHSPSSSGSQIPAASWGCACHTWVQEHGGWSAGQEETTWLPQWPGGGQHSFQCHFSTAPDSSVPKLALAISNFDISSGNHVTGTSGFKIRVALTFVSSFVWTGRRGLESPIWPRCPGGEGTTLGRCPPIPAAGTEGSCPTRAWTGFGVTPQGWPGDEMWDDVGGAGIIPPWSLACSAFQLPSEGQHSLV